MRYLGASAAVLVAAMTFSALGQAARAFGDKPVIRSMMDRNTILAPSANSSTTITLAVARYMNPPTLLEGLAEIDPSTCTEIAVGAWTNTPDQPCQNLIAGRNVLASGSQMQCGIITTGTETDTIGSGICAGSTFTFATIYYEWTAHNNQSTLPAPPNSVADTFNATWAAPDGSTVPYTFNISVPVVRPDHETTAFVDWWPDFPTIGEWKQTLVPPDSDPKFDFSGETVLEFAGGVGRDSCYFPESKIDPQIWITGGQPGGWPVEPGNVWEPDRVGWLPKAVKYYRHPTPPPTPPHKSPVPCGYTQLQQMRIRAPSDPPNTYTEYGKTNAGNINVLGASMTQNSVTSERAGMTKNRPGP